MKVGMFMLGEFWPIIGVVIGVAILLILIMVIKYVYSINYYFYGNWYDFRDAYR